MGCYSFSESAGTGYGKQAFIGIDLCRHLSNKISLIYKNFRIFEFNQSYKAVFLVRIQNATHDFNLPDLRSPAVILSQHRIFIRDTGRNFL